MWIFLSSAYSAVLQGSSADVWKYVAHTVSTTVKSQAKDFPPLYGNVVMPSGLFLSVAKSPLGSQMAANYAVVKAFWMRLLAWLCLAFLLIAALLQLKPCLPNRSTVVLPHIQGCGRQIGAPILRAQAILKLELLSFKPRDVTGYAFNQSLACLADTAFRRASSISEVVALKRLSYLRSHSGLSHRFWAEGLIGKSPPWFPARKFDHF